MITTTDNPYNPFDEFEEWYRYDRDQGYHSCEYLSRIVVSSDDLPEEAQARAIENAVDEIVKYNILGIYRKVVIEE